MTIVEKLKLSLEMLGGVATLNNIYKVFKKIDKDSIKTPQSSIRARIYENFKTLDAYNGEDLFRSIYGRGEGVFSLTNFFNNDDDAKFIYELKRERIGAWEKLKKKKTRDNRVIISNKFGPEFPSSTIMVRGIAAKLKKSIAQKTNKNFNLCLFNSKNDCI